MQRADVTLPPVLPPDTMDMLMQVRADYSSSYAAVFFEESEVVIRLT